MQMNEEQQNVQGFNLSPQQRRLWLLAEGEEAHPYRAVVEIAIRGALDPVILGAALNRIVGQHEILRTSFERVPGLSLPLQVIAGSGSVPLHRRDVSSLSVEEQERALVELRAEAEGVDLAPGGEPVLHAWLAALATDHHRLLLALPALCADAASLDLLTGEIGRAYERGDDADGEILQYADAAEWLNQLLESEDRGEARASWDLNDLSELAAEPAPFESRGGAPFAPRTLPLPLPPGLGARVSEAARVRGVAPAALVLGAWTVQLRRLTDRPEVLIGLACDGRRHEELAGALGLFERHVPLRVRLDDAPGFSGLLRQIEDRMTEAATWQEYFDWGLAGSREAPPVFPFCFSVRTMAPRITAGGIGLVPLWSRVCADRFKLRLEAVERNGGLELSLAWDRSFLRERDVALLGEQLVALLESAVADRPADRIEELSMLSAAERQRLVVELNDTGVDYPREAGFHELFRRQAECNPDRLAVSDEDGDLTYRELAERSRALAHQLRALGVGPEVRVGLCLERSGGLVTAILGVLEAGGAYVPLEPSHPAERLSFVLADSGARVVVTSGRARHRLPATEARLLDLDEACEGGEAGAVEGGAHADDLAYVLYTSGSTGRPKGVMVPHRGLVNYALWAAAAYGAGEGGGTLVHSSPAFDLTVTGLLVPLVAGGRVRLLPEGDDVEALGRALRTAEDLSLVKLTPAHLGLLGRQLPPAGAAGRARALVIGGEALFGEALRFWRERAPGTRLINEYGPTEAVVGCCVYEAAPGQPLPAGAVPIGRPIANARMYVLDRRFEPAAAGERGELCIGGDGVARGYLGRPELTAEKFVPDPFSQVPGARLYRTGDLGRHLPEGDLDYVGRADFQLKIRGYRIEPGEIEAALVGHDAVREAVVVARDAAAGDRRLVAYCVPAAGAEMDVAALRSFLAERLPEPMIPSLFVRLDEMPLTTNGKVDRRALPAPEPAHGASAAFEPPATPSEEILAGIFAEVLGAARVGRGDSFFDLGGHSLLAAQVISRVRALLRVELPVRSLFAHPVLAELGEVVDAQLRAGLSGDAPPIERVPRTGHLPLSFAQLRLWFIDQMEPGNPAWNIPVALRLRGLLDRAALTASLNEVARRHEPLRTVFASVDGHPGQVILPELDLAPPLGDLTALPDGVRAEELRRLALADLEQPFDLARGPLARATLLRLGGEEHALLFTMHHIVSDGWSMEILMREVSTVYAACLDGRPAPLPELPVQYADFARWQRIWLHGEALESRLAYWRRQLASLPPVLHLPIDRPRPAVQSWRGANQPLAVPAELGRGLRRVARDEGVTLFMLLAAALQTLLARSTNELDLCLGTPVAGRDRLETEGLIGFFVNTLVLRGDLAADPSFRTLLAATRETCMEAYAHQDLPFDRLVEELRPERSLAHAPLFQILLVLQNALRSTLELPGLAVESLGLASLTAKLDLTLALEEQGDTLAGGLEYSTQLFDRTTIDRMARHFEALLAAVVDGRDLRVSELPLVRGAERQQILLEWQGTAGGYDPEVCLHELFAAQARRTPDAPAARTETAVLTYRELDARTNRLANRLRALAVGPGVRVGISVDPSLEMLVCLLGVLKAGGAYVPLDPGYPEERLAFMLADADVHVVLTERDDQPWLAGAEVLRVDAGSEWLADAPDTAPEQLALPATLAYVIYTSGSTGQPKGVMIPHRAIANRLLWMQEDCPLTPEDRVFHKTPINFDASIWEIFVPWIAGAQVVLARPGGHRDTSYLARAVAEQEITVLQLVPSLLGAFLEEPGAVRCTSLKRIFCGGEALQAPLRDVLAERLPGVELHNLYGPTEAAIDATHRRCRRERAEGIIPIGRPISNARVVLLQKGYEPAPIGVPGELHIGGMGLARGYLGRPELTAERFVPHPFATEPGERLYRTGDLARSVADGNVEFLGRVDHQVKLRGFRIELGEIESVLANHPKVREAVVVLGHLGEAGHALIGYVVPSNGGLPLDDLRRHMADKLPEHMVPTVLIELPALPRTPNGKLDRRALPDPEPLRREGAGRRPETAIQQVIAAIWGEVLGIAEPALEESFFELGGHSLLATQVMARLREAFAVDLPLRCLFESPTVAGLARAVEGEQRSGLGLATPPLRRGEHRTEWPLSFAQQRLWFLDQLDPGNEAYNLSTGFRLTGDLQVPALWWALEQIALRHDVLRGRVSLAGDEPVFEVEEQSATKVPPLVDLSSWRDAGVAEARRRAAEEAERPFDLSRGPLWRALLLRLHEREHVLVLTLHHLISDGWSTGVLLRELSALYAAACEGRPADLPELPVQYGDYTRWQRDWLQGEALERQMAFWREHLAGAPAVLELPTDRPRPAVQTYRGEGVGFDLPEGLWSSLTALGRAQGATPFMLLLGGFSALLSRLSGQPDVVVGSPIANRNPLETEGLIGLFANTLALRSRPMAAERFTDLLAEARRTVLDAAAHQDLPFEKLVEELQPERDLSRSPLFQVLLAQQNGSGAPLALPGLSLEPLAADRVSAQYDLTLHSGEVAGTLHGLLVYNTGLFDRSTAVRWTRHLEVLLAGVAMRPEVDLADLPLLSEAEAVQVAFEWNDTAAAGWAVGSLPRLFAATAARLPDATAVLDSAGGMTYAGLDAAANRLARRLRALGVREETGVGICLERSADLLVALLGVLKAGGFYVPLDPLYPRERLQLMLSDSGASVLVTEEALREILPFAGEVLCLDTQRGVWMQEEPSGLGIDPPSAALAYVIYTSGSTGRPKGVEVTHGALVNFLRSMQAEPGLDEREVLLAVTSLSFDIAGLELYLPLLAGGTVALASREEALDGIALAERLRTTGATVLQATPTTWRVLLDADWEGGPGLKALVGGEAFPPDLASRLVARAGGVWNVYGPTETTIWSTIHRVAAPARGSVPIGHPIANTSILLLDRRLRPVPSGVAGELYVGGQGLARGYRGRPDLTAERFLPDPLAVAPGARVYRTGDAARRQPDGTLEYLGRTDQQVKVRGFRIEPGEIEALLAEAPAVAQAVVVARAEGGGHLAAYVVPRPGLVMDAGELRSMLRRRLPEYMVPSLFVELGSLPLTPNGKIDRRALPAPEAGLAEPRQLVAPRTPTEEALARIWSEVLGHGGFGVHDSFFDVGGHSLLATRVVTRMRRELGVEMSIRDFFVHPTLDGLAGRIEHSLLDGAGMDRLDELLAELEEMDEDDVLRESEMLATSELGEAARSGKS
jgi:amino acid adenylation domain-containing protein